MSTNETFIPTYETCKEVTDECPVEFTVYGTDLSKPAATFFGIAFGVLLVFQLYFGIRSRTWSFIIWLGIGTIFEVLGYWARTKLAENPWDLDAFTQQYLTLLLAPTLVAAAISVTFKHLVIWYGAQWSVLRPSLYPWVFVGTDFLSIFIQVAGGAITAANASGSSSESMAKAGEKLVVGGVAFQVANMVCCGLLMLVYIVRRRSGLARGDRLHEDASLINSDGQSLSRATATEEEAGRVRKFVYALVVAYIAILVRCSYRIAENIPAISLNILRNEPLFLGLDSAMIMIAVGAVTVFHPFIFFPFLKESKHMKKRSKQHGDYRMQDMS
ncbi:RTA1 like protein [Colletotrichum higginsianum]|uniref:RTA1 like protein n=2 Tax=Colletotrichum higginsianum TaxID=80884 RepID=H1VFF4_COLHI|nr:RTA1 like protein [Colletotrichum higginsianum IMI 349063]OBR13196.1 RTA1 like protein [Colletotrichum higginsianum IMI 349063]TID01626.1 Sphingoid long-chain base transporter RSB1 [Colletotrichum higginsianum]GJC96137.1 RTA1 like protein [Colletotrichum higginsianum]CCF38957.1 RTA1 like protein [Colletotrichum higginsianum]